MVKPYSASAKRGSSRPRTPKRPAKKAVTSGRTCKTSLRHPVPPGTSTGRSSVTAAKLVHQPKDPFADLEQLLARLRNHGVRQKPLRSDGFQPGLGLMQMIQRLFQIRDGERRVEKALSAGDAV